MQLAGLRMEVPEGSGAPWPGAGAEGASGGVSGIKRLERNGPSDESLCDQAGNNLISYFHLRDVLCFLLLFPLKTEEMDSRGCLFRFLQLENISDRV